MGATISRTLLVPLAGEAARATDAVRELDGSAEPTLFPLSLLSNGGRRVLRERRYDRLALVGTPPTDEIGYAFSALLALAVRPREVALVDLGGGPVLAAPLVRYLARAMPLAAAQLAASGAALVAQRFAVSTARRERVRKTPRPELGRLLYIRPAAGAGAPFGGSVTHSHELIRAIRGEAVDVEAYTTDAAIAETAAADPDPPCNWHVLRTPRATKAVPASAAAGGDVALVRAALAAARSADAVYQRHARFSLAGALLARLADRPLLLEYNGSEPFKGQHWNATPLQRRLAACEDAVVAAAARVLVVSEVDRRLLLNRGVADERIVVNPNGVDPGRFGRGGGAEIRSRHAIGPDRIVLGFVGSFGPWHGATVLARAFAAIVADVPDAHLLLVGDGPELEPMRETLRESGVADRTTMVGQVLPSAVPAYLDACDLLVSPHVPLPGGVEFFGSPTKLFEYMAAGKAIVASRLGQIGDVLEHGVTGWLVEPGDATALGDAVRRLAGAPELRRGLGARAREQAERTHSWRLRARRVIAAYASITEEPS